MMVRSVLWAVSCLGVAAVSFAMPEPALWMDADEAKSLSVGADGVSEWRDVRGGGFPKATSWLKKPHILKGALNGRDVLDFGEVGSRQALRWDRELTDIKATFLVLGSQASGGTLLGAAPGKTATFRRGRDYILGINPNDPRYRFGRHNGLVDNAVRTGRDAYNAVNCEKVFLNETGCSGGYDLYVFSNPSLAARASAFAFDPGFSKPEAFSGGQRLAEVIIYTNALTEAEIGEVEKRLMAKWRPGPDADGVEAKTIPSPRGAVLWLDASRDGAVRTEGGTVTAVRNFAPNSATPWLYPGTVKPKIVTGAHGMRLIDCGAPDSGCCLMALTNLPVRSVFLVVRERAYGRQELGNLKYGYRHPEHQSTVVFRSFCNYDFYRNNWASFVNAKSGPTAFMGRWRLDGRDLSSVKDTVIPTNRIVLVSGVMQGWGGVISAVGGLGFDDTEQTRKGSGGFQLAELLVYDRTLGEDERADVEEHLKAKWHLTDTPVPTSCGGGKIICGVPSQQERAEILWTRVICREPGRYIGWATLCCRRSGELIAAFSGDRDGHVCPWGRQEFVRSYDNGETWTRPVAVHSGILDDRDVGLIELDDGTLLMNWFSSICFCNSSWDAKRRYDTLAVPDILAQCGNFSSRSTDGGITWEKPVRMRGSANHGGIQLKDGRVMVVGRRGKVKNGGMFHPADPEYDHIKWELPVEVSEDRGRSWKTIASIVPQPPFNIETFHEPHLVECGDGRIIAQFRCPMNDWLVPQVESKDGGRTWGPVFYTKIRGYPPHFLRLRNGKILDSYGWRSEPAESERVVVSDDDGRTWDTDRTIWLCRSCNWDMGYPSTVELSDGTLLTLYYQIDVPGESTSLMATKWKLKE